jgi:hypothetical protein
VADFETYLYAKHVHGPFRFLKLIRFPHITSHLSWLAKYNIMVTEFHRLSRRVTNHADLWDHLGRIACGMCRRGYQPVRIMRIVRRLFYQQGARRGFSLHCHVLHFVFRFSVCPEQGVKLLGLLLTGSTGQHMAGRNGLA